MVKNLSKHGVSYCCSSNNDQSNKIQEYQPMICPIKIKQEPILAFEANGYTII